MFNLRVEYIFFQKIIRKEKMQQNTYKSIEIIKSIWWTINVVHHSIKKLSPV